jgi:hypothetical protein
MQPSATVAAKAAAATAAVPRIFRRVTDVFVGGVLCTLVALAIWIDSFVVGVRAGGEVAALPRLGFSVISY